MVVMTKSHFIWSDQPTPFREGHLDCADNIGEGRHEVDLLSYSVDVCIA